MSRQRLDVRIVATLLAGLLAVWAREATRTLPTPAPGIPPTTTELPMPPTWRGPGPEATLHLQPSASRVEFAVDSTLQHTVAAATGLSGALQWDQHGEPAALSLTIDLAQLQSDAGGTALWRLLGCKHTDRLGWNGRVLARTTFAVPGVARLELVGPLQFAGRVRSQPMQLWIARLPGRVIVQGVGTVDGDDFGLPRRYLLGLLPDRHRVTLALHLEFARNPEAR
ncbi:MAG: hypothetical protein IPK26_15565 [Planctomycetes bacterium]|nr:hypothetical protein [Planctomycetota bacterium]